MALFTRFGSAVCFTLVCVGCDRMNSQVLGGRTAPSIWIDAPLDGSTVPLAPVEVVSHSTDPFRISRVELSVNGSVIDTTRNSNPSPGLVTTRQTWRPREPGNYTLSIRARNSNGFWGDSVQEVVTVEGAMPSASSMPTRQDP